MTVNNFINPQAKKTLGGQQKHRPSWVAPRSSDAHAPLRGTNYYIITDYLADGFQLWRGPEKHGGGRVNPQGGPILELASWWTSCGQCRGIPHQHGTSQAEWTTEKENPNQDGISESGKERRAKNGQSAINGVKDFVLSVKVSGNPLKPRVVGGPSKPSAAGVGG